MNKQEELMEEQEAKNNQKVPYPLSLESVLVNGTEDMIYLIKRTLPNEKRRRLNRSKFFEILLEAIISDYKQHVKKSCVYSIISEWSDSDFV